MLSLPWSVDYFILYYNKEIFQKKGVAVPEDARRDGEARREAHRSRRPASYGFVGRGLKNANMTLWTNFFLNYGGEFLDAKGNILTDGPEAIEATKIYQRCSTKSAPPGVAGFNWMEVDGRLRAGARRDVDRRRRLGAAASRIRTPRASSARSATRWCRPGRRASTRRPTATASALRPASKNKEAAYLYCQWAVSKTKGARLLQAGGGVPFRNSVLNDAEVRKGVKMPQEWLQSVDRMRRRSASSACRSSSRSPNSATSSARRHGDAVGRRSGDGAEEGDTTSSGRSWSAARRRERAIAASEPAGHRPGPAATGAERAWRPPSYWPFVLPALIVVLAVIVFPWVFTIWMSLHEWKVGAPTAFVGLANYLRLPNDPRFVEAVWHTLVYTVAVGACCRWSSARSRPWCFTRNFRCAASCAACSSCR